jgi:tetratricopeptide (TPR) repeat protein
MFAGFVLAGLFGFAAIAHAACTGPSELVAKLKAQPSTDNEVLLGGWYASHKQFDCAAITFRAGLKTDPKSAQLHYLLGLALLGQEHAAQATTEVEEAARLEPRVIKPHLLLATLYEGAGKTADAEEQWHKALSIDPKSEEALEGLSAELLSRKDYAGVIAILHSAPRTERLAINLSQALGQLNYLDAAAQVLTEAIQKTPESLDLPKAMAVVLINMHRYEQAIKLVQTTAAAHPNNMDAQFELFRIFVLTNHFDRALQMEPKLLAWHPHDPQVLYLCGMVDRAVGKTQEAKAHLEESVALDPNFFNSRYNLGIVLVLLHEWKDAKENLEKAIELDTPVPEVHFELAKALRGLGETDRAAEETKTYQALRKSDETKLEAAAASAQGDKDLEDGKTQEAATRYREAIESAPNNAVYKYKLSIALRQSGDSAAERAQLEEAIQLDPKLAGAQNELGYILARDGDASGAVEHFRMAVQAAPAWTDAWINLAAELAVVSRYSEAREAVAKALSLEPDNAQARELNEQLLRDPAAHQANPSKGRPSS